jgi:hypothetical protein
MTSVPSDAAAAAWLEVLRARRTRDCPAPTLQSAAHTATAPSQVYTGTQAAGATRTYASQLAAAAVVLTLNNDMAPAPVFAHRSQSSKRAQRTQPRGVHKLWTAGEAERARSCSR